MLDDIVEWFTSALGDMIQGFETHGSGVTALATVALVLVTVYYAWYTRQLVKGAGEQLRLAAEALDNERRRDKNRRKEEVRRAAMAIRWELEVNLLPGDPWQVDRATPLLDAQYNPNAWALTVLGLSEGTQKKVGQAYLKIRGYNLALGAALLVERRSPTERGIWAELSWTQAQKHVEEAVAALDSEIAATATGEGSNPVCCADP